MSWPSGHRGALAPGGTSRGRVRRRLQVRPADRCPSVSRLGSPRCPALEQISISLVGICGAATLGSNSAYQPCEPALEPGSQGNLATLLNRGADELRLRDAGHAGSLSKPAVKIWIQPH